MTVSDPKPDPALENDVPAFSAPATPWPIRLLPWLCALPYIAVTVHHFFAHIDYSPYLAVDDILANVSSFIAEHGRFGFPASPMIGTASKHFPRMDGILTYGPWYFYLGGALSWLFGYSLTLMRSLHLLLLLTMGGMAAGCLADRHGRHAAAVFTVGVLYIFNAVHWPMARPDIMVSLLACAFMAMAWLAVTRGRPGYWLLAGFFAASAAYSHLIAWALVPACVLVLAADLAMLRKEGRPRTLRTSLERTAATALGGLSGAFLYFWSIDFRFSEHFLMLTGYQDMVGGRNTLGYVDMLVRHLKLGLQPIHYAWTTSLSLLAAMAAGVVLLAASPWMRPEQRRRTVAMLLPPAVVLASYVLSLGGYKNYHGGYSILVHVAGFWLVAASVHALLATLEDRLPRWRRPAALVFALCLAAVFINLDMDALRSPKALPAAEISRHWSKKLVGISDYQDMVLRRVPRGVSAWGSILFGLKSPDLVQLVQFSDAARCVQRAPEEERPRLAPSYLLMSGSENYLALVSSKGNDLYTNVSGLFPSKRYALQGLVAAKPYGTTRIYSALPPDGQDEANSETLPHVAAYDSSSGQWGSSLSSPVSIPLEPCDPFGVIRAYHLDRKPTLADRTFSMTLPAGWYLFKVGIHRTQAWNSTASLLTLAPHLREQLAGDFLDPPFSAAPYFHYEHTVRLLYRHPGGPAYLSQFDPDPEAMLTSVLAYRVRFMPNPELAPGDIPGLNSWARADGVELTKDESSRLLVRTNATPATYQIWSSEISVTPGQFLRLELPMEVLRGRISVGVLNQNGTAFIYSTINPESEHVFETGTNHTLRIVISNANPDTPDGMSEILLLGPPRLSATANSQPNGRNTYADTLVETFERNAPSSSEP